MKLRHIVYFFTLGLLILLATTVSACQSEVDQQSTSAVKSSSAEECRVIQHALGKSCIPTQPQRIITLDIFSLGNSIILNTKPFASGILGQESALPEYLESSVGEIEHVGAECQPNLERIMLLKPDLILGRAVCSQSYSSLSAVAPTVLSDWYVGTHWRENFDFISNVLEKEALAQAAWNHYYNRVRKLRSILAEKQQSKEVSVVDIHAFVMYPHVKNSFSGTILSDLKLQRPKLQDVDAEYGYTTISEEEIQKIDGDILFLLIGSRDDEKFLENLKRKPLWQKLRAAQTDQIYVVKSHVWWGGNLIAANLVLDDIEKYLVK